MRIQKDNKAVSPVIGIMLMLVVTVILAAAVSSSSSGLMKSTEKAPFAVFDVKVAKHGPTTSSMQVAQYMQIRQITGDFIDTKDLKIVTINPKGVGAQAKEILPTTERVLYGSRYPTSGRVPYYNNPSIGSFGAVGVDFGNFTFKPGVTMVAQDYINAGQNDNSGTWNATSARYEANATTNCIGQMQGLFADWDNVSQGDIVTVKIIHLPSDKVIFASDVEVI